MRRFVVLPAVLLLVMAVLGAFPAHAGANHGVPFKGSAELTVQTDGTLAGTGEGTHLGRFTEDASLTVNGNTFTAKVVLTAANGDKVFKMASGTISSNGTTTTFSGTFMVLGGTGRFTNATGTGVVATTLLADGIHVSQTFDGTIRF